MIQGQSPVNGKKNYFDQTGTIRRYREKGINIISIVMDAPQNIISSLSGRIGRLSGISCKVTYSKE